MPLNLLLNKYVLGLIGSAALLVATYFAWQHYVAEPYREQGRNEMIPALTKASDQLKSDEGAFIIIEAQMRAIKANSDRLKALVVAAQKTNAARATTETAKVSTLEAIQLTGATECEKTSYAIGQALRK